MSNILVRSLTGAVFISLVLLPLFWLNEVAAGMFGFFMVLGLIEFYKLFNKNTVIEVSWEIGLIYGLILYGLAVGIFFDVLPAFLKITLLPLLFIVFLVELWRKKSNPLLNASVILFGIVYVTLPFILMVAINNEDTSNFPLLAGMFILIWMNDTFAYLSGRFFGKTKLIERISPNKTWEGTIGGILFTIAAGFAIGLLFDNERILFWAISAVIIAPCAILGDLLESLFKRNMDVKDSGNILPGHGGILDRFDATLFTVPFFMTWTYFYMYF
jgi:phosphatidate cytidylyltransferase